MYRPDHLDGFIGQTQAKKQVVVALTASKKKGTVLPHILLTGPSGTGKTTLAYILAKEMGHRIEMVTPAAFQKNTDLYIFLSKAFDHRLGLPVVVFLDEVHRMKAPVQEEFYLPMEDGVFVRKGQVEKRYDLPEWTLIGATTAPGNLEEPFLNRFGLNLHLEPYTPENIQTIIEQSAIRNEIGVSPDAVAAIAQRSRANPRIANHLLARCDDFALTQGVDIIDEGICMEAFDVMDIDHMGFSELDRVYLRTLYEAERPIGIASLVPILHTDKDTIAKSIEPFLVESGFVLLTARGRQIGNKGVEYIEEFLGLGDNRVLGGMRGGG